MRGSPSILAPGAEAERWLGTQRLLARGPEVAEATLAAARAGGVAWLDTADVYGAADGEVEAFLAARAAGFRIATKGGLVRHGARLLPDGRAGALVDAALRSRDRLGRIDRWWLHAPDPRVDLATTGRALAKILERRIAGELGVCNVTVGQLRALADHAPIAAVQVAGNPGETPVARSGILEECALRGLPVVAYRALGGTGRARPAVRAAALARGLDPAALQLAWLRDLGLRPLVGTTEPAHVGAIVAELPLDDALRAELDAGVDLARHLRTRRAARRPPPGGPEVVLIGGPMGAGKSTRVAAYPGHVRLNRDQRGDVGLDALLPDLGRAVRAGRDVVLDNTYPRRSQRAGVVEAAWAAGATVRLEWLETSEDDAERNAVERLLDALGDPHPLPAGRALEARPGETTHPRWLGAFRTQLEPPELEEGFAAIDRVPFVRRPRGARAGLLVPEAALDRVTPALLGDAVPLVYAWRPGADAAAVAAALAARLPGARAAVCPHPAGPPDCWCRPPLPGLPVWLARQSDVDLARSRLLAASPADRTLARKLGLALA